MFIGQPPTFADIVTELRALELAIKPVCMMAERY